MDRRSFVFLSSGAAIGNLMVSGDDDPEYLQESGVESQKPDFSSSGLVTGEMKPLKHEAIPGFLSAKQIAPHHTAHYGGALKGYMAADLKIESAAKSGEKLDGAAFGALKRAVNSKGNSVVLHEMYFDGLALAKIDPTEDVRGAIAARFGSIDKWAMDFVDSARSAAGWAMLVKHPVNGKLYNVVSDEHSMGVVWMAVPLVVIDTYEHAFYIDYENRKGDYVQKFLDFIDWNEVQTRFQSLA